MNPIPSPPVVLGSGSLYRRELLGRILPVFEVVRPDVDETPRPGEGAETLARRLAELKAEHVAATRPDALVIGSDQVAECAGEILGKPGSVERAVAQLRHCAGRTLTLHTAVCLWGPGQATPLRHMDQTQLRFHALEEPQIRAYVQRDQPLDCAGSFKFEALGAVLFNAVNTHDPTAIQGLPLLWLAQALVQRGVRLL